MNNINGHGLQRRGGGMQVHSVPESERALDSNGQRLPWAYEYAETDRASQRRAPEEKGPFGKALGRRGTSRSKTFTPTGSSRKEDQNTKDNWKQIDDIFQKAKENTPAKIQPTDSQTTAQSSQSSQPGVATEVILYGYGEVYQWSAIEFYERVSLGVIYEDYDRSPPNPKYNQSLSRSVANRGFKIPSKALKKVNKYHGGIHWIKITFDSIEAADRACNASPHRLNGYLVYAEPYRGTGPNTDQAIPATDAALRELSTSPSQSLNSNSSLTFGGSNGASSSSTTASSATATAAISSSTTSELPAGFTRRNVFGSQTPSAQTPRRQLVAGAKRVEFIPVEKAVLPATSRWQRTFGSLPVVGFFLGGSSNDMIGDQVPLKENGEFDWDKASLYWKFWASLDYYIFFANFLGLKGDE